MYTLRIITQKFIVMFPEGQEAWTVFRRTGYPKLFPVVNNNSGGAISSSVQVRRLSYPLSEGLTNTAAYTAREALTMEVPACTGIKLYLISKQTPHHSFMLPEDCRKHFFAFEFLFIKKCHAYI